MILTKDDHFDIIKELAAIRAPAGLEDKRAEKFIELAKKYIPDINVIKDKRGNAIIKIKSSLEGEKDYPHEKIAIFGHLDEIGATVARLNPEGTLSIQKRGGIEARHFLAKRVQIYTLNDRWVNGVVMGRTIHAVPAENRESKAQLENLQIFVGAADKKDLENMGIHVGAPVVFTGYTEYLNESINKDIVISNSLDNIGSLAIIIDLAAKLNNHPLNAEIVLVATVREEVGREGALHFARDYKPNIAIAIDFGVVEKGPNTYDCGGALNQGPFIVWTESSGREIFDYKLTREFVKVAEDKLIQFQHGVFEHYGSDSGLIQKELGIPSVLIAFPMLMGHNVPEIMALSEIEKASRLIHAWIDYKYLILKGIKLKLAEGSRLE